MTLRPSLSVVSPVYACEGCIEELCDRLQAVLREIHLDFEIILVCDGSPDSSWQRIVDRAAHDTSIVGLRLARNVGQHCAISAGLEHARGKWIVVMDCDLQDVPEEIAALYTKACEGFDIVFAQRTDRQDTRFKRLCSRAFYHALGYLTDTRYDSSTANFGIFSARAIEAVNALPERGRFFPLMVRWAGFPTAVVPVAHARRHSGQTTYAFGKLLRLAVEIVLANSDKPLRLVAKAGVAFSVIAFALAGWSVYRFVHGDVAVAGYTSIIASTWLLGGVTVFSIGVVGLYVGRMFNDIKQRPYYTIGETVNLQPGRVDGRDIPAC
jgi:dolichol-phosphate mannosyltransferase